MHRVLLFIFATVGLTFSIAVPCLAEPKAALIFQDDFQRTEADDTKEDVGNGWGTNSKSRASGNKQVDLRDGAMHITRHEVADHGVSVHQDVEFRDAVIQLRFKLGNNDDLGINIADMKEKSVHAGHLCMARLRLNKVEITDLKTGRMDMKMRTAKLADKLTSEQKDLIKKKTRNFKVDLAADTWHDLVVTIDGERMAVEVDGKRVGAFESPGIGHPTKRRLRLAVGRSAWVDDVKIWRQ